MYDLRRKLPLHKKHFFERLKVTVLLITCGTSTLKSLLPQGAYAPHVYPRLRKRLSRCTLDCGFKTPESPALRGFVAERAPIRGTSLYLVLKSNGLRRSKNLPVKFDFSLKTVPANMAKKLPSQRCPKPFLIPPFNFSHKRLTFAFAGESGYTLGSAQRIAHNGSHGETRAFRTGGGITTLDTYCTFTNIPGPGIRTANFAALGSWPGALPKNAESLRNSDALMRVAVPRCRGPAGLRDPVVRPLMLRFSVSVRKVSAQSPVNATRSSSHLNPSTTQPCSKNRTQRHTRRNVCALDVAILEVSCYTDGHRKPLKNFLIFLKIV